MAQSITFQTQSDWQSGILTNMTATRVAGKILLDPTGTSAKQGAGWAPVFGMVGSGWTYTNYGNGNLGFWSTPGNSSVAWSFFSGTQANHGWMYRLLSSAMGRWETNITFGFNQIGVYQTQWFHFMFNNIPGSITSTTPNNGFNLYGGYSVKIDAVYGSPVTGHISLIRNDTNDATEVVLGTATYSCPINSIQSNNIRVDRDATGLMHVYLNNVLQITATDATYQSGTYIGFHAYNGGASNTNTVIGDNDGSDSAYPPATLTSTWESPAFNSTATPSSWNPIIAAYSANGATVTIYTSSSPDNITYSPYVAATSNQIINSPLNQYLKAKVEYVTTLSATAEPQMSTLVLSSNLVGPPPGPSTQVSGASIDPSIAGTGIAPGTMIYVAGSVIPSGFLLCDGTQYPTATYPNLFSAIGYTYGGSGANFNVPDCRSRAHIGKDAGTFNALGLMGGSESHSHTSQGHTHTIQSHYHTGPSHTHSVAGAATHNHSGDGAGGQFGTGGTLLTDSPSHTHTITAFGFQSDQNPSVTSDATAPGTSTDTSVQSYIAFNHCIKV